MRAWGRMLGGLLLWAIHFLGVYAIASIADVVATADDPPWRVGLAAFSAACVLGAGALCWRGLVWRRAAADETARFRADLAVLGAGLAGLAIAWQALPAWIGH